MEKPLWQKWLENKGSTVCILRDEHQNAEYGGCIAVIDEKEHRIRFAKTTPKKIGQFVAIWEKNKENNNVPFESEQSPERLSVFVYSEMKRGVFTFPKEILQEHSIYTFQSRSGKMAFRVYPAWDHPTAMQAIKTQQWQLSYFSIL